MKWKSTPYLTAREIPLRGPLAVRVSIVSAFRSVSQAMGLVDQLIQAGFMWREIGVLHRMVQDVSREEAEQIEAATKRANTEGARVEVIEL